LGGHLFDFAVLDALRHLDPDRPSLRVFGHVLDVLRVGEGTLSFLERDHGFSGKADVFITEETVRPSGAVLAVNDGRKGPFRKGSPLVVHEARVRRMGWSNPPEAVDVVVVDVLSVPARLRMLPLELAAEQFVVETVHVEGEAPLVLRRGLQVIGRPDERVHVERRKR